MIFSPACINISNLRSVRHSPSPFLAIEIFSETDFFFWIVNSQLSLRAWRTNPSNGKGRGKRPEDNRRFSQTILTSSIMTEVRASELGHLGLFAQKDFSVGDVILEEEPVVKLAPSDDESSRKLLSEWLNGSSKDSANDGKILWDSIKPPPSKLVPNHLRGTFKGMVQAGIVFMKNCQGEIEPES